MSNHKCVVAVTVLVVLTRVLCFRAYKRVLLLISILGDIVVNITITVLKLIEYAVIMIYTKVSTH
jgi:hypothetical protein